MKGIILHGGKGTRLRPLTHTGPKQLIKVGGKPISQWGIENLIRYGITDIAIVLGNNYPEKVVEYYGDGSSLGAHFTYIYQGEARGLAEAIYRCKEFVDGDRFVVHLGDNIVQHGLEVLVNSTDESAVLLAKVDEPSRYGIAVVDGNKIVKLVEKPKEFTTRAARTICFTDSEFIARALGLSVSHKSTFVSATALTMTSGLVLSMMCIYRRTTYLMVLQVCTGRILSQTRLTIMGLANYWGTAPHYHMMTH